MLGLVPERSLLRDPARADDLKELKYRTVCVRSVEIEQSFGRNKTRYGLLLV